MSNVEYQKRDNVAVITINRPEAKNAVDKRTADELQEAWERFDESDQTVGVLTGSEKAGNFSAGADLKKMDLEDQNEGYLGFSRKIINKPTVAAVEGHCVAGGLEMALWCDLRVASESAVFGCFERRFGVPLVDGGTQRLPRVVGQGRALEMILTGRPVEADEALKWGLINRKTRKGEALETAVELGQKIASFPQSTVRADRKGVYESYGRTVEEGLERERNLGNKTMDTAIKGARNFEEGAGRHGQGLE